MFKPCFTKEHAEIIIDAMIEDENRGINSDHLSDAVNALLTEYDRRLVVECTKASLVTALTVAGVMYVGMKVKNNHKKKRRLV